MENIGGQSAVEALLEALLNGEWHTYSELYKKLRIEEDKLLKIARFWAKYSFIELDEKQKKMRILEDVRRLLLEALPENVETER